MVRRDYDGFARWLDAQDPWVFWTIFLGGIVIGTSPFYIEMDNFESFIAHTTGIVMVSYTLIGRSLP